MKIYQEVVMQQFLGEPEVRVSNLNEPEMLKYPIISSKKVKKITME
jgi:hypothetical protein